MNAVKLVFLFLILSLFFSLNTFATGSLSGCGTANSAGLWTLTEDINDGSTTTCVVISSDDVILDCQGHLINTTNDGVGSIGISINLRDNITIQNCEISNWGNAIFEGGIRVDTSTNLVFKNILFEKNRDGIYLNTASDSIFTNITFSSSDSTGILGFGASNNNFSNVKFLSNLGNGISFISSNSNKFTDLEMISSGAHGISLSGSDSNSFDFFNLSGNSNFGANIVSDSDFNIFTNGHISSNTNENVFIDDLASTGNIFNYVYLENASGNDGICDSATCRHFPYGVSPLQRQLHHRVIGIIHQMPESLFAQTLRQHRQNQR